MLLTHNELVNLVKDGAIENVPDAHINAASIDVRLGDRLLIEDNRASRPIDLTKKESPPMRDLDMVGDRWWVYPGSFVLASTMEVFNLPDDIAAEFKLRSSVARAGLNHSLAGWADPGWHGATLTMELHNALTYNVLLLEPGMRIGQMVFWRGEPVPNEASYRMRGRYNLQSAPTESKGI